jgi:phosphoribosylformylglycinamidine cyclo-ligase
MPARKTPTVTYADAGVSIERGDELVERIKPAAARTARPGVLGAIGGFGSLFDLSALPYRQPVLVSGTDGAGTKVKLAADLGRHDHIGIDLVAMCVNDVLALGAEPLFFLDYFACGRLDVDVAERVVAGIARGCELAGCALVGGETAEMPGLYKPGEYDLAGFCVGAVEKDGIIDGSRVAPGDVAIGLASSGPHANGYSLVRKLVQDSGADLDAPFDGRTLADVLMEPTRIYVKPVLALAREVEVKAIAHITGGGLPENLPRVLPDGISLELRRGAWPQPAVFDWLRDAGNLEESELLRTFNCGIGLVLIVGKANVERALERLAGHGERAFVIGEARPRASGAPQVAFA